VVRVSLYTALVSTLAVLPTQLYRASEATDTLPILLQGPAEYSEAYLLSYLHCTVFLFLPLLAALPADCCTSNNFVSFEARPSANMTQLARLTAYTLIGIVGYKLSLSMDTLLGLWCCLVVLDCSTPLLKYIAGDILLLPRQVQMVGAMLHTLLLWGITLTLIVELRSADDATALLLGPVLLMLSFKGYQMSKVYKMEYSSKVTLPVDDSDSDCCKNED